MAIRALDVLHIKDNHNELIMWKVPQKSFLQHVDDSKEKKKGNRIIKVILDEDKSWPGKMALH